MFKGWISGPIEFIFVPLGISNIQASEAIFEVEAQKSYNSDSHAMLISVIKNRDSEIIGPRIGF